MSVKSPIEWTDATWTPIRARVRQDAAVIAESKGYASLVNIASKMAVHVGPHCEHVSPGCDNCYSETGNGRCLPVNGTGLPFDRRARDLVEPFVDEKILVQPLHWRKPRNIFVCSQTDLFGEWVTDEAIDRVFAVMALCPQHTFQVLTKRAKRMREYLAGVSDDPDELLMRWGVAAGDMLDGEWVWTDGKRFRQNIGDFISATHGLEPDCETQVLPEHEVPFPLPNVWLGVSVEDQPRADERRRELLRTPAAVRFLSVEPLLGPISLKVPSGVSGPLSLPFDFESWSGRRREEWFQMQARATYMARCELVDWIIVGGESGPGARPMHPDWVRSLRDQCVEAGVPFFFKQWGEFQHGSKEFGGPRDYIVLNDGRHLKEEDLGEWQKRNLDANDRWRDLRPESMGLVGKKAAGRLLDGCEWNELPVRNRA